MQRAAHRDGPWSANPALLVLGGVGALCGILVAGGQLPGGAAAIAVLASPLALYLALTRPMLFPYGLYVLLIPFDNLLGTGQGTITKIFGIIVGVSVLLWSWRRRAVYKPRRADIPLLCLALWILLSSLWTIDQSAAMNVIPTYLGLFLLYAALASAQISPRDYRILLGLTMASGVAATAYGLTIFYHTPAAPDMGTLPQRLVVQGSNTFIDPNQFGNALMLPMAAIMMMGFQSRRVSVKILCLGVLAAMTVAIVLTASREALIGALLIFVYYFVRTPYYRWQITIIALAAGLVALRVPTLLWIRFGMMLMYGGSGRTAIWSVALAAAKHRWLAGYGTGSFVAAYDAFYLHVYQFYPYGFSAPSHSLIMHFLVEGGIIGLALVGWLLWEQWRSLRAIGSESPFYKDRLVLEAAFIALIAASLTIDLFTYKYFWLLLCFIPMLTNLAGSRVGAVGDTVEPQSAVVE